MPTGLGERLSSISMSSLGSVATPSHQSIRRCPLRGGPSRRVLRGTPRGLIERGRRDVWSTWPRRLRNHEGTTGGHVRAPGAGHEPDEVAEKGPEQMSEVQWSTDVSCADWIRQRLAPFGSGEVKSVVPDGFAAYARVLHPARDSEDLPVRWLEVAARNGLDLFPGAQFPEIALLPPTGGGTQMWDVVRPQEGTLAAADATALVDILRRPPPAPERCWFWVWGGYGGETGSWPGLSFSAVT